MHYDAAVTFFQGFEHSSGRDRYIYPLKLYQGRSVSYPRARHVVIRHPNITVQFVIPILHKCKMPVDLA